MDNSALTNNKLVVLLASILPARMKRLVYLASLTAALNDHIEYYDIDTETVRRLNNLLNLSTTGDGALRLPIRMSSVIWENKSVLDKYFSKLKGSEKPNSEDDMNEFISNIINCTPDWIRYSDERTIESDLKVILHPSNELVKLY